MLYSVPSTITYLTPSLWNSFNVFTRPTETELRSASGTLIVSLPWDPKASSMWRGKPSISTSGRKLLSPFTDSLNADTHKKRV